MKARLACPERSRRVALLIILASACAGGNMRDQPRCDPLEASPFFADGRCARPLVPNTVSRGQPEAGPELEPGESGAPPADQTQAAEAEALPFPITREVLEAGRQGYEILCAPCHGLTGYGDGMIVQRGFPAPPSFHSQRLRAAPPGHFYAVITNGFGLMYSYAYRTEPQERWQIVAYIRALQLSQNASTDDVPPEERGGLEAP